MPLITVLVPCKNGAKFLQQMLNSVLKQSFSDYEVLVVDDGSIDESREIVLRYAESHAKIKLEHCPGEGIVSAMNHGIKVSDSEFIARIDVDDELYPNRLESQIGEFLADSGLAFCGSAITVCDANGDSKGMIRFPMKNGAIVAGLREGRWVIAHPAVMYKREVIQTLDAYSEDAKHAEDLDLWLRAAKSGYRFKNIPRALTKFRVHGNNDTILNREKHHQQRIYALWRDYSSRSCLSIKHEQERLFSLFSILALSASKVNTVHFDRLLQDLRDHRIKQVLTGGFILQKFVFSLLKYNFINMKISNLPEILALLVISRGRLLGYFRYYLFSVFPVYIKNRKFVSSFLNRISAS